MSDPCVSGEPLIEQPTPVDYFHWSYVVAGLLLPACNALRAYINIYHDYPIENIFIGFLLLILTVVLLIYLFVALVTSGFHYTPLRMRSILIGCAAALFLSLGVSTFVQHRFALSKPFYEWRVPASVDGTPRFAAWEWESSGVILGYRQTTLVYDESGDITRRPKERSPGWLARAKAANKRLGNRMPYLPYHMPGVQSLGGHFYLVTEDGNM